MPRDLNVEVVSANGTTQATATAISIKWSHGLILAAGNSLNGVRLPAASKGRRYFVKNTGPLGGLGGLNVYPETGDAINALSANAPLVMAARTGATFICTNATTWETIPNVPS